MTTLRHILRGLLTIWLAATTVFFMLRVLPGDAIEAQLAQISPSQSVLTERRERLGLADPLPVQYLRFISGVPAGNLGYSLYSGQPVTEIIAQRLPGTTALALAALVVSSAAGVGLGMLTALRPGWGSGVVGRVLVDLSFSVPIYWTGTLLVFIAAARTGPEHLLVPAGLLGFHSAGAVARVVHTGLRETMAAEFVRAARARGLPERRVVMHHILRVGLLPVVTVIALQAGFLFGGTVITESIFLRPGLGTLLLDAVIGRDYPVVQGVVLFVSVVYVMLNTLADLLYRLLDPRVAVS